MKVFRSFLTCLVGIASAVLFTGSAQADLILLVDDGLDFVREAIVIDDQPAGVTDGSYTSNTADGLSAIDGAVLFAGSAGSWDLVVSTGQSKPLLGPATMDLTVTATSSGPDSIAIWLIDTDFLTGGTGFMLEWALDAANNSFSFMAAGASSSNSDTGFGTLSQIGPFGDGFFTDSGNVSLLTGVPFSLALVWATVHFEAGTTTGNVNLTIPEPMTAALFGMGLLGIGAVRRRKKQTA